MAKPTIRLLTLAGALIATVALLGACSSSDNPTATPAPAASVPAGVATGTEVAHENTASVDVSLKEWSVAANPATVGPGEITFRVKNDGNVVHEMVAVKTDLAADKLPLNADGNVDEEALDSPGEASDIPAGQTSSVTLPLEPGHYVLFCNLPGHYKLGMTTEFTVQ